MTNALNLSIIEGRLVRKPELRQTTTGKYFTHLSVAVSETVKIEGKPTTKATFLSCTVWGKCAEHCVCYLVKGQAVRIKGRLQQTSWTDRDGQKHSRLQISANNVEFLAKPKYLQTGAHYAVQQEYGEAVPF